MSLKIGFLFQGLTSIIQSSFKVARDQFLFSGQFLSRMKANPTGLKPQAWEVHSPCFAISVWLLNCSVLSKISNEITGKTLLGNVFVWCVCACVCIIDLFICFLRLCFPRACFYHWSLKVQVNKYCNVCMCDKIKLLTGSPHIF